MSVVLDYPYENALCMFITKEVRPDFYNRITNQSGHPYYDFLTSGFTKDDINTSLNLAILFEKIHIHPIDLPIYSEKDLISTSEHHDNDLAKIVRYANQLDSQDSYYQKQLNPFKKPRAKEIITGRINWHLLDSQIYNAPIIASNNLMNLYNYKFSRAVSPQTNYTIEEIKQVYETLDNVTGISFKIDNIDALREIRNDNDVSKFRKQLFEYIALLRSNPEKLADIKADMEVTKQRIEQIERFEKFTSWSTYISASASILAALLSGSSMLPEGSLAPVSGILTAMGLSNRFSKKIKNWKYSWMLFKRRFV